MAIKKESPTFVGTLSLDIENCTTELHEIQDKFVPRLDSTFNLADAYTRLGMHKQSEKVASCGNFLLFRRGITEQGELAEQSQLHRANFCKDRLCPMCAWRRGLKVYSQTIQIANALVNDYNAIFLTLTVPNCSRADVSARISEMQKAWDKMMHWKRIKDICKGYIKSLEVSYNSQFDTMHPHFHVVIFVPKDYGKKGYIAHSEWLELWRKAMNNQDILFVDIRRIYENEKKGTSGIVSAIAETCKYPFKPTALNYDIAIETLSHALQDVKAISYGGICKELAHRFKFDDIEQGDLTHTDLEHMEQYNVYVMSYYGRAYGSKQYDLFKQIIEVQSND